VPGGRAVEGLERDCQLLRGTFPLLPRQPGPRLDQSLTANAGRHEPVVVTVTPGSDNLGVQRLGRKTGRDGRLVEESARRSHNAVAYDDVGRHPRRVRVALDAVKP
jgi:hypothetical protein